MCVCVMIITHIELVTVKSRDEECGHANLSSVVFSFPRFSSSEYIHVQRYHNINLSPLHNMQIRILRKDKITEKKTGTMNLIA